MPYIQPACVLSLACLCAYLGSCEHSPLSTHQHPRHPCAPAFATTSCCPLTMLMTAVLPESSQPCLVRLGSQRASAHHLSNHWKEAARALRGVNSPRDNALGPPGEPHATSERARAEAGNNSLRACTALCKQSLSDVQYDTTPPRHSDSSHSRLSRVERRRR
jgi:hypothetical protein